jgi:hypothetical protein
MVTSPTRILKLLRKTEISVFSLRLKAVSKRLYPTNENSNLCRPAGRVMENTPESSVIAPLDVNLSRTETEFRTCFVALSYTFPLNVNS